MRAKANHNLPTDNTLLRNWRRWESGESRPDDFYAPLISAAFDTVTAAFFPRVRPNRDDELLSATGMDTLEFVSRLRMSDVSDATLDAITITADRLCHEYSRAEPHDLLLEGTAWLRRITSLLDGRLTLAQHRRVLELAGWVALLVGCVEYDLGHRGAAEATRCAARSLGEEAEHDELVAWAAELAAWFALTQGNRRGAAEIAASAGAAAGHTAAAVQLAAQQAKAWARLGDRSAMETALRHGRAVLDHLPQPVDLDNHFAADAQKFDFYAMDCYRVAGDDRRARDHATEVLRTAVGPEGVERAPMRVAEAHLTLAVVAARAGDLELAVAEGVRGLDGRRRSLPSLLFIAGEAAQELSTRFPGDPRTRAYLEPLRALTADSARTC
ncbi:XRE family transcriptional regulator [Nocardia stercoris]|uniref:XRE family transcriptional regulator n=2 Tax=Nocardia stercoris TaxID=2483361 RepID=A0A3M2L790_9NOCA|nr:XRE family transcriptional regulator [Nocardia stercoris]